jgi:hypothetical protein
MTSLKNANRRVGSLFAVAALVLATITPGLVPAFASAAQLTERSVALSSSSKTATGVDYTVKFSSGTTNAGAVVLEFCANSPLIDTACTPPTGFSATSATATGFTPSQLDPTPRANALVLAGTIVDGGETTIPLTGVTNPSAAGTLYVRISTFVTEANAQAYVSTTASTQTGAVDQGSAAVSITDSIGVSAAVLESMTFCVSGIQIELNNCTTATPGGLTAPTLKLGEDNSGVIALDQAHLSQGSIYTQLSTNAVGGAAVNIKSGNDCGGLKRANVTTCDIAAANTATGNAALGQARIGIAVDTADVAPGALGTYAIAGGGSPFYNITDFKLNYNSDKSVGVTSPFGDPVLQSTSTISNKNAKLTFAASVSAQTPAGLYANDYSLIATGKY